MKRIFGPKKIATFLALLILGLFLTACGWRGQADEATEAPAPALPVDPAVAAAPTEALPEPTATESPCPPGWPEDVEGMSWDTCPAEWGVLYLKAEQDLFVYELVGINANGFPIFVPTAKTIGADEVIVVYNSYNAISYDQVFNDAANAQGSIAVPDTDPVIYEKEFPGRWRGDGAMHLYEIAGEYGAGFFVRVDQTSVPDCEDLFLKYPLSCTQ